VVHNQIKTLFVRISPIIKWFVEKSIKKPFFSYIFLCKPFDNGINLDEQSFYLIVDHCALLATLIWSIFRSHVFRGKFFLAKNKKNCTKISECIPGCGGKNEKSKNFRGEAVRNLTKRMIFSSRDKSPSNLEIYSTNFPNSLFIWSLNSARSPFYVKFHKTFIHSSWEKFRVVKSSGFWHFQKRAIFKFLMLKNLESFSQWTLVIEKNFCKIWCGGFRAISQIFTYRNENWNFQTPGRISPHHTCEIFVILCL